LAIEFGRDICGNLNTAERREWLLTNGIGGYASGTVAGLLTRRYHGILIAALQPPLGRTLVVAKFDEIALYNGQAYPLFTNRWADGTLDPKGYTHIERFQLDGAIPVWSYAFADALIEKRMWMQPGANTTYVQFQMRRGSQPLTLNVKALVNYRDHHSTTRAGLQMQIDRVPSGLSVTAFEGATPVYLLSQRAVTIPNHEWYRGFSLSAEQYRGFEGIEDHLLAGEFQATLKPGESLTLVASTEAEPNIDGHTAYKDRRQYEKHLIDSYKLSHGKSSNGHQRPGIATLSLTDQMVLAADQFIVRRGTNDDPSPQTQQDIGGRSIIAGYPWFGDWGRDTMISLPGLALATGRPEIARQILRTYANFVDQGMLPNRFPDASENPEFNTVDATLWYFEAIRAYHTATVDDELLKELFPVLREIIAWHQRGTRYNIYLDPGDGLLYAGESGVQLTWMDARVGDWVVTPRIGKPVEINALWYNALRCMADFARILNKPHKTFRKLADLAQTGFTRFWFSEGHYCFDVIDGPDGEDSSLRPNQIMAVSLPYSPLSRQQQKAVVDVCARYLLTSFGLRSLAPNHPSYVGHYGGDGNQRDGAYHQGTVWSWLIGPFVSAHLRVYKDKQMARSFLQPLIHHLEDHGLGSVSEIYDGDPPFTPRGCFAQAWSVAELLRAWLQTSD
jgi:predicted glycogen debranching enzyme